MRLIYYAKSTLLLKTNQRLRRKQVNSKYCLYVIRIVFFFLKVRNRNFTSSSLRNFSKHFSFQDFQVL
jgi:hypothetical protein